MLVRRISFAAVLGVVALAVVLVLSNGLAPAAAQAAVQTPAGIARTITVVGRGEVKVPPKVAYTTVGVEVTGGTVDAALKDAQARMAQVLAALKQLGIADKDIQTSNFSINFERQIQESKGFTSQATPGSNEPPAGFYRVSNMVQVTIRDLTKVAQVLDTSVEAGANNIWGLSFGLDQTDALETQAREAAVKNARERAEALAKLTGVEVGEVVSVSEIIGSQVPMYAVSEAARGMGGGGTPVEPGEVSFSTQIQVVYAIE